MLDLILAYFKGICLIFRELLDVLTIEVISNEDQTNYEEVESLLIQRIGPVIQGNAMVKIFSLKDFNECDMDANI